MKKTMLLAAAALCFVVALTVGQAKDGTPPAPVPFTEVESLRLANIALQITILEQQRNAVLMQAARDHKLDPSEWQVDLVNQRFIPVKTEKK